MTKQEVSDKIRQIGILPALRVSQAADILFAADAISAGGIPMVEVTMTVPGALEAMRELARQQTGMIVGAGTVLDRETARQCVDAGASFLTSTGLDLSVVEFAHEAGIVVIPGALTPTEIITAWRAGSDFVKVFPCAQIGGPGYIRAVKAPLKHIPLIAAGGVNQQTAAEFIYAGASAVGVGGALIPQEAVRRRQPDWIIELARRFLSMVKNGRNHMDRG